MKLQDNNYNKQCNRNWEFTKIGAKSNEALKPPIVHGEKKLNMPHKNNPESTDTRVQSYEK